MAEGVAEPSEAEKQARVTRQAALAIGEWLIGAGILTKRINDLRVEELEAMAAAALSRAAIVRADIEAAERLPVLHLTLG